ALAIKWLFNFIGANSNVEDQVDPESDKATNFGDFNKLLKEKQMLEDQNRELMKSEKRIDERQVLIPRGEAANISIREGAIGADGLSQTELRFPNWQLPPLNLLKEPNKSNSKEPAIVQNGKIIEQILASFGIQ